MNLEDSDTYQWIIEQGMAKGEIRGRLTEARFLVTRLGARRFGPPPAPTLGTLNAIGDLERMERIADRIVDATGWDGLLATP